MPTITGVVETADGQLLANRRIEFLPIQTPVYVGSRLVLTSPIYTTTDDDGAFSVVLRPNLYQFNHRVGSVPENHQGPIVIRVPNTSSTYTIDELIQSDMPLPDYFGGLPEPAAGASNSFATIAIAGQSSVVADSPTDTLTIVAGANVTLTTDAASDTITIAATPGGVTDGDKGGITVSGGGTVWTVDDGTINTNKLGGDITAAGKALLDDADATAQRATLGLGSLATQSGTFSGSSSGTNTGDQDLSGLATSASVTSAISTHSAAADPHGDRAFATAADSTHAAATSGVHGITTFGASLVDDADASAARTTLGLGTAATTASSAYEASGAVATHAALTATHGVSGSIVGTSDTQTLTNKRITRRVSSISYASSITPNADTTDVVNVGTLTGTITINAPSGTPTDGQLLTFRFVQNATGYAITWDSAFAFGTDVTSALIPTTASAKFEVGTQWNATDSKWRVVALVRGF